MIENIYKQDERSYWCVVCGRELLAEVYEHGVVFVHDDVPHHESLKFDEDQLKH